MSALPQTFPAPTLTPGYTFVSRNKTRAALTVVPRSSIPHELSASPAGAENPGADFASIYHTYRRRVFSQCLSMLRSPTEAEDAAQEVFLQLFRKVHTFRGESSFATWLHRLTTNCVLMEIRRMRRRSHETPLESPSGSSEEKSAINIISDSFPAPPTTMLDRVRIGAALSQLPSGYQRIFELHDVEGYTHNEIATLLSIQAGTSKSQLHKARLRLRCLLQAGSRAGHKGSREINSPKAHDPRFPSGPKAEREIYSHGMSRFPLPKSTPGPHY